MTITARTATPSEEHLHQRKENLHIKKRTKEELDFIQKGGEIKTYRLSKTELEKMGYLKEVHND